MSFIRVEARMKVLITLESSTVLRNLLVKWSEAVAARRAANAAYFAREIRVGVGVVLASPSVLAMYLQRARLPVDLPAPHVAVATTIALFPETAPAFGPTRSPTTEPQPPSGDGSAPE